MTFDQCFDCFTGELLPSGMSDRLVEQLRALAVPVSIARKHALGLSDPADHLVFLVSGATKLVAKGSTEDEQILSFQFAGDCVSVPHAAMHAYSLVAMRRADILIFDAAAVHALAAQNPDLSRALSHCTLTALHQCREQLLAVGRRSATERVASFLLAMREVRQVATDDGHTLNLIMTRREIADCLGLTVETVSRQFSKLRDMRLIETPSRSIVTLNDPDRLAVCAGNFVTLA